MAARNGAWSSTCRTTSHSLASNSRSGILSICGGASPEGHSDDKPTLDELFEDGRAIERALREAARRAERRAALATKMPCSLETILSAYVRAGRCIAAALAALHRKRIPVNEAEVRKEVDWFRHNEPKAIGRLERGGST